jgi:hypothetical protein
MAAATRLASLRLLWMHVAPGTASRKIGMVYSGSRWAATVLSISASSAWPAESSCGCQRAPAVETTGAGGIRISRIVIITPTPANVDKQGLARCDRNRGDATTS